MILFICYKNDTRDQFHYSKYRVNAEEALVEIVLSDNDAILTKSLSRISHQEDTLKLKAALRANMNFLN